MSLGSINADFQMRTKRQPEVSETLLASDFVRLGGGKAANIAYLARKLGKQAQLFAHTGDDDLAEQAMGPLRDSGVDLSGIKKIKNAHTGVTMITVPPDGKKSILMAANANGFWCQDDATPVLQAIRNTEPGSVLVADCEIPVFIVEQAMRAARQRGVKTILDPSPADRVTDALLKLTDFIAPNAGEAKTLTGIECEDVASAMEAGNRLRERGVAVACIKLADGGCVVVEDGCAFHIAPVPVDVVDTTGAGDAFTGGLAVALLEHRPLHQAACFAVAASHLAVTAWGSQPAYPTREQIERMEARLDTRTHVRQPVH
ncbi:MAG TPA: ribokinase [Oxalicibacterium sp.]|nr:ribokinase [Oxalicibacterium sp.]